MPLIELKNIVKTYALNGVETPAVNGVNLSIERGGFVCLAGSSGSGKTTLLNLVGTLDKPTSGQIFYEGKDITATPVNQLANFRLRSVGFIFQAYNLINTLTAIENVEYVLLLQKIDPGVRQKKSQEILERVGLGPHAHKPVNRLSGGQQQRVAVARAIVAQPGIILADEPTANLDSATSGDLLDLMYELNREKKIMFLFSTHDRMVMDKADKVYHMRDGKIVG